MEKIRVVFTIPELRQKILLTLLFLAIYRVGWWIPLPIVDNAKMAEFFGSQGEGGFGTMLKQVATFQRHDARPGHDLRPGHHALYLGVDYFSVAVERLEAAGRVEEGGRERPEENQ